MNIELTESECAELFNLLDVALKAKGVEVMQNVYFFSEKLKQAKLDGIAEAKKAKEKGKEPKK